MKSKAPLVIAAIALAAASTGANAGFCRTGKIDRLIENGFQTDYLYIRFEGNNGAPAGSNDHTDITDAGYMVVSDNGMSPEANANVRRILYTAFIQKKRVSLWSDFNSCKRINSVTIHYD